MFCALFCFVVAGFGCCVLVVVRVGSGLVGFGCSVGAVFFFAVLSCFGLSCCSFEFPMVQNN